ncbi:hypothetical protein OTK49_26810, partial [Vibrio coralliirubri]|uniref:hypothetical protein n=1 Tax=Vibrio coralliirubri TaxID=1516159 RepID=UPI002284BD67
MESQIFEYKKKVGDQAGEALDNTDSNASLHSVNQELTQDETLSTSDEFPVDDNFSDKDLTISSNITTSPSDEEGQIHEVESSFGEESLKDGSIGVESAFSEDLESTLPVNDEDLSNEDLEASITEEVDPFADEDLEAPITEEVDPFAGDDLEAPITEEVDPFAGEDLE